MANRSEKSFSGSLLDKVTAHLKKVLSSVTNSSVQSIDANAPIEVFGVRAILQMTNQLEKSLGWLSKTLYFEYPNLAAMAQYFVESHSEKLTCLLGSNAGQENSNASCHVSRDNGPSLATSRESELRQQDKGENIAIIGLSCRFPQARNMHEFWDNLRNGRDCIEEIPGNRWNYRLYFDEERNKLGKTYGKWGGFVEGFDQFDPTFFNITPREAEMMDPQERVFLQCVYSAVEDAGYTPRTLNRNGATGIEQPVGVYVGLMFEEYNLFRGDILGSPASIANRISYFCNFRGPSIAVDTMCSSSLTAIHLACQSLKRGECGSAIAGGVNLTLHPNKYLMLARLKMASPKGQCKAFGENSDGYVPGEGVGAVVLKTLPDALADGDHIYGVIQATAINQSGKTRSYFAPSPNAQAELIEQACKTAGISPRIVTCIEAHGTGTSLGDPIEVAGLTKAFRKHTADKQYCAIGSVKSNVGHCEGAAGIAGLTKVLLQMKHAQLVPSLHSEHPNTNINFGETPFAVQHKLEEWKRPQLEVDGSLREYPRIAGISSFGAGGANAHVVVEEYIAEERKGRREGTAAILLSAKTEEQLRKQATQLLEAIELQRLGPEDLWDMAYTLQVGREGMEHRLGLTAETIGEVAEKLKKYAQGEQEIEELYSGEVKKNRDMAAAFSGDEDLVAALENWLRKGKWAKLLDLWTKGVEIDWSQIYLEGEKPRRVSLPTYPFAGERHWVEPFEEKGERKEAAGRGRVLHPLVQTNSSRVGEQRYTSQFSGEEFFLAEHRVGGNRMLPGVAYLEMARAAIEQSWPGRPESTFLELRNTVWAQPIIVSETKQISISLLVNDDEQIDFEIFSQDGDQEIVHCHGQAVWSDAPVPAKLNLSQRKQQLGQGRLEPSTIYAGFARVGLVHGPSLQAITAVHRASGQALAHLCLPRAVEETWEDFVLHPSLMDGALQATAGVIDDGSNLFKQTRLPFALESLRIIAPCTREMVAWVRNTPGSQAGDQVIKLDIDLCDESGNVCVQMKGFSSRELKNEESQSLIPLQEIQPGLYSFVPVWNPARYASYPKVILPGSQRVLLLGGDLTHLDWVQQSHPNACLLQLPTASTTDVIQTKLKDCSFDQLLWIAPDVATSGDRSKEENDDRVIEHQEFGVLAVFRIVKALLHLGYGDKELRWTIITGKTQQVKKTERIQPTHAAIFGLVGSLAKEYPHWDLSLLDVESLESVTAGECLSMPADKRGNGLACRQSEWFSQEFVHVPFQPPLAPVHYRQNGVYVVIGGAGGLGEVWSRFMIENYQASVVWIGRREYNATIEAKINSLTRPGKAPLYISADATKLDSLQRAFERILESYPAIHGVVHSALVLQDQSLAQMEESKFRTSLSAKVDISVNLERVFARQELDFMLFFSSIMSFIKAPGQANYAAGCTFKDSFAQKIQQQRAYPVKIMNWGYWGRVGIVAGESYNKAMESKGIGSIEPQEGMEVLQTFLSSELSQMGFIKTIDALSLHDLDLSHELTYYSQGSVAKFPEVPQNLVQEVAANKLECLKETPQITISDPLLAELLASSLMSLGLFQQGIHRFSDLRLGKQPAPFYERWLSSSIYYLQQRELLGQDFTVTPAVRALADLWPVWEAKKSEWSANPDLQAQIALLEACLKALPAILSGKQLATDVMFPDSSIRLVEGIYRGNRVADYFNEVLGDTLSAWVDHQLHWNKERRLRVLEIGAGTGGTTIKLLPLLQRLPIDEYCYTDLSKAFLMHAEEQYQPQFPALTTVIFDVSKPLAMQSIEPDHYDVVIATNVLHATPSIRETLRNAKATLKNQGILLLNEIGSWSLFTHLTFGLLEGWWLHEDTALRLPGSPGLSPGKWQEILTEEGFESIFFPAQPAHEFGQQIIAACSNGWVRQPLTKQPELKPVVTLEQVSSTPAIIIPAAPKKSSSGVEETLREKSLSYFQNLVASTLKMRPDQIEPRRSFAEYGLDSILIGQLTYRLRQIFSDIAGTLFFEVQSINGLVDYFLENKKQELAAVLSITDTASQASPVASVQSTVSSPQSTSTQSTSKKRRSSRLSASVVTPEQKISPELPASEQPALITTPGSAALPQHIVDVAIIGLSGRYPRSNSLKELWMNLSKGVNCITEIPKDRWDWEKYFAPEKGKAGKIYTKWGGFIDGIDQFDPSFFKISPKEAKRMDPQERLFLEACYHAIEDAGYTPENLGKPEKIGVFVGVMNSRYTLQPAHASIANRVSYLFNFQGPSMAVDTACSSSLTAIHVALESIYSGLSTCAIAGGVNLIIDPVHYVTLAEMTMLSSGNQCKAFGEQADGLVDAEGVGAVVLKPLQQAQLDGDHIYAVIKGSAINAGGRTHGYTVPNPQAQAKLVSLALERAKVTAEQVSYVEAHGTGTALGDPIEIAGLTKAFKETSEKQQFCSIGSLKSNIGHCESAAGIAGLTKVLLQLKYEQLAPSLHSDIPNPEIDFGQTPFKVQKSLEKWERPLREVNGVMQEVPRIAGISSFGAGGSNAHVIVQEYQAPEVLKRVAHVENTKSIIVLSARNMAQLKQKACDLLAYIREEKESVICSGRTIDLASMAYTLQVGRESMEERLGLVVSSVEQLVEKLQAYVADRPGIEDLYQGQVKHDKEALSLFNTDADLQQTIDKWIANQKLSKLLDLWVKGLELDWSKLYGQSKPQRISLPAYPFARERYWIETAVAEHADKGATTAVLHPLLHSNTSDLSQQCYSSTFTGEEFFLKDYQVDGQKTLPVAAYLEMARVAVEKAAKTSPEMALELRNVVWAQPVIVTQNKQISIALLANKADQIDYEIYSQEADEEVIHCQGSAIWSNLTTPPRLDLEQLKRQTDQGYLEPGSVYATCARIGLAYGPTLQGIKVMYRGNNQLLAQLELPKTVENTSSEYLLHPSLIDSVLQAAIGLIDGGSERLPFAVESLRIVSSCPPEMFAWVCYAPVNEAEDKVIRLDIDLCDKSGNIVAQMRGASWQQVSLNVVGPVVETAADPMVPNETISAPRARKEIILIADKPSAPVPVEKKKRAAISLAAPGIASAMAVVSSERPAIKLSNALLGRFEESAEAAVSSVRLFDDGNGIFSIQITDSNAQTKDVIAHLLQALERVQQEVSVKVVLFRGLEHLERGGREDYNQAVTQGFYLTLVTFPSPVIAVLQGDAQGAAMLAAALCDFMVCNEDASYGYTDPSRHFYPTTKEAILFSERFGAVQAQEFLYGSTAVTGKQLQAKGWTCPIVSGAQVETFAEHLASTLAAKSQEALRLLKQNLTRHLAGVVQEFSCIEFSENQDHADSAKVEQLASPAEHIHLGRPAEGVLVIKFGVGNQKLERKELVVDLGRVFEEARQSACKAIVLASEYPGFLPEMESTVAEGEDFQHLLMELEIPVIAALEGDAKGTAWLTSQYCDACVYNQTGTYSFPSNQQSPLVAQNAAVLFAYRMGDAIGQEIVLTGAEYSGINLQQRVGALRVVEHDEVLATAIQVAASWAKFPRAILADWKKQGATTLREKIRNLPAWEEK
ncbi:MAG TPA: SDR family NAD(P)-dependent oxidoreductase, partial [Candidatus Angelobacter sp.]|nr:SDR family NAD(P)-dependent oxidoreductase [Candidatus Angelobacter sp.]